VRQGEDGPNVMSRVLNACIVIALIVGVAFAAIQNNESKQVPPDPERTSDVSEETAPVVTTEVISINETIPFQKQTRNAAFLDKGKTRLAQLGVNGLKRVNYEVTYTDGVETSREYLSEEITYNGQNEITEIGTYIAPSFSSYTPSTGSYSSYGDLNCEDIGYEHYVGYDDPNGLDRDGDGWACEGW
jgi:hypothetical protein